MWRATTVVGWAFFGIGWALDIIPGINERTQVPAILIGIGVGVWLGAARRWHEPKRTPLDTVPRQS